MTSWPSGKFPPSSCLQRGARTKHTTMGLGASSLSLKVLCPERSAGTWPLKVEGHSEVRCYLPCTESLNSTRSVYSKGIKEACDGVFSLF